MSHLDQFYCSDAPILTTTLNTFCLCYFNDIGQYTNWVYEILHLFAQPTLEATLNDTFDLYDDTIPLVHLDRFGPNMATMVTSHLVVGLILSPLELVRTRYVDLDSGANSSDLTLCCFLLGD